MIPKYRAFCDGKMYPVLGLFWDEDGLEVNLGSVSGLDDRANWRDARDLVLMAWTGLWDKNGVEIYERDVLRVMHFNNGGVTHPKMIVEWEPVYAEWLLACSDYSFGIGVEQRQLEVYGNIYENPELLKEKS